ncbi:MAG: DedA family protein, partial [Deferribacterota bacterium]|nr:DedA family protein [Deferribacterota bacterium]
MTIESSFIPFPSELVMPPAGYLCSKGAMSIYLVIIFGTLGSLFGALINYYLSYTIGLPFLLKYGRFIFINQKMLKKVEVFFLKHG